MDVDLTRILDLWLEGESLGENEAGVLLEALATGALPDAAAGGLLIALRMKGEAPSEIRGFALAMRRLARRPALRADAPYVDIVGTGGDASGSLNLSTGSALLAAACGLEVVKHGNRSVSSASGSADVLAELGLPMPLDEAQARRCLEATGFTFLFAPHYHPAMKHIAPVRRALGVRTVFNILGPLTNPVEPPFHVIGAFSEAIAAVMADTLAGMPLQRAFVVHGAAGWDEATPMGPFSCYDVRPGGVLRREIDPADYGLPACDATALLGTDPAGNTARLRAALEGRDTPAHRDALVLGAALALEVTGRAPDLDAGVARARSVIADGTAARWLAGLDAFAHAESAP
jgi:anthranilate phosphoribosyltransferase